MDYKWDPPKYAVGQLVTFNGHERKGHKPILTGRIGSVTTDYWKDMVARHSYTIRPEGWRRDIHVGEDAIFWKL